MRRFGRTTAFVLVFAMVFTLFAALGMYGGEAGKQFLAEASASGAYVIVEIVPSDAAKHMQDIVNNDNFGDKATTLVKTYTPQSISENHDEFVDDVAKADLFVINQDGVASGSNSFYGDGNGLAWKDVFLVFKRIAGVNGSPARYIIDESVYENTHSTSDGGTVGIPYADKLPLNYTVKKITLTGKNANIAKLYMMLKVMDPANFYGIYFTDQNDNYGIDIDSGKIRGYKYVNNSTYDPYNPGYLFDTWDINALKPYFLINSGDTVNWASDIGFNSSITIPDDSSTIVDNRGIVFKGGSNFATIFDGIKETLSTIISNTVNINYKNYGILVVEPNVWGSTWNRSIAYKFYKASYGAAGKPGLIGGVKVDTFSMYNFASYLGKLDGAYDCIYLGSNSGNGVSLGPASSSSKLYSKLGSSYSFNNLSFSTWGKSSTNKPGLDLTKEMSSAIKSFANNNLVVVSTGLTSTNLGSSNIKTLLADTEFTAKRKLSNDSALTTSNNIDFSKLKALIDAQSGITLNVLRQPNLYNSDVAFQYENMNPGDESNRMEYKINDSDAVDRFLSNKKLEFEFSLNGASSYTAKLYIDKNADGRFTSSESVLTVSNLQPSSECRYYSADKNTYYVGYSIGDGFKGALYWKLEISATGLDPVYISGCSAVKSNSRKTINIIQIIPVDSETMNIWSGTIDPNQRDNTATNIILPMKSEINNAGGRSKLETIFGGSGIGNLDTDEKTLAVQKFFDDEIEIETREHPNGNTLDWDASGKQAQRTQSLLASAGMFYYFVEKEGEYDINVLRVSTKEFANRLVSTGDDKITYDPETGNFTYKNPDPNASGNVSCDLVMLGFGRSLSEFTITGYPADSTLDTFIKKVEKAKEKADTTQKNAFVNAADRILTVIMNVIKGGTLNVTELNAAKSDLESNKSSYGEPFDSMYTATVAAYNKAKSSNGYTADPNYVDPYAAIMGYIDNNRPIFIGYGVVKANSEDKMTKQILDRLGMDRYGVTTGENKDGAPGYTYAGTAWSVGDGSTPIMYKANEGTMTNYPYSVPEVMRGANVYDPIYQLDMDNSTNDISVFYTFYSAGNRGGIGDVINEYYMYKKGNITYCGMGHNESGNSFAQTGTCIKLPEAALLVNAIVATQGSDPHGNEITPTPTPTPLALPNIIPTGNPGSTETTETVILLTPTPSVTPSVTPTPISYTKSTVYVYPEYDGTKNMGAEAKPSPMPGNPAITESNAYSTNSQRTETENVMKFNFKGDVPGGSDTKATIRVLAGPASDPVDLELKVYKSDGTVATNNQISNNGEYYVLIPLDGDFYKHYGLNDDGDTSRYGMDESENFKIVIETIPDPSSNANTGGVGKKTDINIVKRGIFRID